jgi:glyoxylase-like metal-dependent hydrolase (beta-lactamase superfamily II)
MTRLPGVAESSGETLRGENRFAWPPLRWGERTVTVLSDGFMRLDGGAMFGVVPRVLWEKRIRPDERNRIRMGMNALLVEGPEGRTVIETGAGGKEDARFQEMYGIERDGGLPARLDQAGAPAETIERVVLTHLHFDHAGGATRWAGNSRTAEPAFSEATYYIHSGEYEATKATDDRSRASYFARDFVPLVEAGVVEWIRDGDRVGPGIEILETPGHTSHHVSVAVDDGAGRWLVFLGDLIPTTHHLAPAWIMAYDLYPMTTLATKQRVLARAHDEQWLCAFVHDADRPLAYLTLDDRGRPRVDEERDPWNP